MGSCLHKDKNIEIYVQTSKQLYMAGQYVQGSVHINCLITSSYVQLNLKFQCLEKISWTQSDGNGASDTSTRTRSNKNKSYSQFLPLYTFHQQILQGHYSFPFKLLLPQGLPGSIKVDLSNFISYTLTAELSPSQNTTQKLYPQSYSIFVNIQEPPRVPFGQAIRQSINHPKCCGCCANYGSVKVTLSCDKNFIRPGDNIKVKALIDNSMGTKKVKNINFYIRKNLLKVEHYNSTEKIFHDHLHLYQTDKEVEPGQQETFQSNSSIPLNYSRFSTALGTILMNYFTLGVASSMGCCSQAADSQLHLLYHASDRNIQQNKFVPSPANWHPKVAPLTFFNDLKPYIYIPQKKIPFHNRGSIYQVNNLNNLSNMQNFSYPQNHQSNHRLYGQI